MSQPLPAQTLISQVTRFLVGQPDPLLEGQATSVLALSTGITDPKHTLHTDWETEALGEARTWPKLSV